MAKVVKVPGEDAETAVEEVAVVSGGLPNADEVDASAIKTSVLTNQGWVVPNVQL